MPQAQEYLNKLNLNREQITSLNLASCNLTGTLDLKGFTNLKLISCENNQLDEIDVSGCPNLKCLDANGNPSLKLLYVKDLNRFERLKTDTGSLEKSSFFDTGSEWVPKNVTNSNVYPTQIIQTKRNLRNFSNNSQNLKSPRNILLFGKTGSGKSTLANVLLNKNDNFEEVFATSDYSDSTTKEVQVEEFTEEGINYRLIDTVGLSDISLNHQQVADKLTEAFQQANQGVGLNRIFWVIEGRFTKIVETYEILKLIDKDIAKYITIVYTHFVNFEDEGKCQKANQSLNKMRTEIKQVFQEINQIVYVDNPPIDHDWEDEEERRQQKNEVVQQTRQASRKILLNHLKTRSQHLTLSNLDSLSQRVKDCLDNQSRDRKRQQKELEKQFKSGSIFDNELDRLRQQIAEKEKKKREQEQQEKERIKDLKGKLNNQSNSKTGKDKGNTGTAVIIVALIVLVGWLSYKGVRKFLLHG